MGRTLEEILAQEKPEIVAAAEAKAAHFKRLLDEKRKYFAETEIECPTDKPAYVTKRLTLEEMGAAVEYEASRCSK